MVSSLSCSGIISFAILVLVRGVGFGTLVSVWSARRFSGSKTKACKKYVY